MYEQSAKAAAPECLPWSSWGFLAIRRFLASRHSVPCTSPPAERPASHSRNSSRRSCSSFLHLLLFRKNRCFPLAALSRKRLVGARGRRGSVEFAEVFLDRRRLAAASCSRVEFEKNTHLWNRSESNAHPKRGCYAKQRSMMRKRRKTQRDYHVLLRRSSRSVAVFATKAFRRSTILSFFR